SLQIIITIIVIIVMVFNLRASLLISALLPLAVLMCFIFMKYFQVDANIVALSGIAIAIGTMVDLGIILSENILRHLDENKGKSVLDIIYEATIEVAGAIITAVSTTIVSFLPVFTLQAAEGKLFGPLAYTKTFALIAALIFTLIIMPAFAHWLFGAQIKRRSFSLLINILMLAAAFYIALVYLPWAGLAIGAFAANNLFKYFFPTKSRYHSLITIFISIIAVSWLLASEWLPLGVSVTLFVNFIFIALVIFIVLGFFSLFIKWYPDILLWCLRNKAAFFTIPGFIMILGILSWIGFNNFFGFVANSFDSAGYNVRKSAPWSAMVHTFPGLGKEFMPSLDEGSFLLMPTSLPHSGVEANMQVIKK
ncbi:MAG: efflux RND transporter permease subunit, partial [Bacteroidota bacterium]|nr:efflux RND transporter permease subunit [Bacteroidota bacterium]